jgi:hypothetical protein
VIAMVTSLNSSLSGVDWCKFCIHLRSLNIRHYGTVEGMELEIMESGSLQWHHISAEFHEI